MSRHGYHHFNDKATELAREAATAHMHEDQAEKVVRSWTETSQPARPPGRYAEPPQNHPEPQHAGQAAQGHPYGATRVPGAGEHTRQLDYQMHIMPTAVPVVTADATRRNPLADAITAHVVMQQQDFAHLSQPSLGAQLGNRDPMQAAGAQRQMPHATSSNQPGHEPSPPPHSVPERGRGIFADVPGSHRRQ